MEKQQIIKDLYDIKAISENITSLLAKYKGMDKDDPIFTESLYLDSRLYILLYTLERYNN